MGEAEDLPLADGSFAIVIATFLIVHLKDLKRFFAEVYRVLKPGGKFLVTNINQRKTKCKCDNIGNIALVRAIW